MVNMNHQENNKKEGEKYEFRKKVFPSLTFFVNLIYNKRKDREKMLDKKYNFKEKEQKWTDYWEKENIYEFIPDYREVYSIDTPPPTVNGKIHMGHIF